jgi:hypothetical protein
VDELDRQSACDLPCPRFKLPGPVVDQVIETGGPAFEIQICRMADHAAWEQLTARSQIRESDLDLWLSQTPGSNDRMPEELSEKSNHNNAKDKASRVVTEGLVGVGG